MDRTRLVVRVGEDGALRFSCLLPVSIQDGPCQRQLLWQQPVTFPVKLRVIRWRVCADGTGTSSSASFRRRLGSQLPDEQLSARLELLQHVVRRQGDWHPMLGLDAEGSPSGLILGQWLAIFLQKAHRPLYSGLGRIFYLWTVTPEAPVEGQEALDEQCHGIFVL